MEESVLEHAVVNRDAACRQQLYISLTGSGIFQNAEFLVFYTDPVVEFLKGQVT